MTKHQQDIIDAIRHSQRIIGDFYELSDEENILLYYSYCNMYPKLKLSEEGVTLIYPIAYYVTEAQREGLMVAWSCLLPSERLNIMDMSEQKSIVATGFYSYDQSDELCSDLSSTISDELWWRFSEIIYSCMPMTVTSPQDPRTLFYSALALYYHEPELDYTYFHIDFNDVKAICKRSERFAFYPTIYAASLEELLTTIKRTISEDNHDGGNTTLLMSLNLSPNVDTEKAFNLSHVAETLNVQRVMSCIQFYRGETGRYSARVILTKLFK